MSNTDDGYEKVTVPRGTFVGWRLQPGQKMYGRVLSYSDTDGSDYNDQPCPLLVAELTQDFDNYREKGTLLEKIPAGAIVSVTGGQANLKRTLRASAVEPGNLFILEHTENYKTAKGEGLAFEMAVSRVRPAGVAADSIV